MADLGAFELSESDANSLADSITFTDYNGYSNAWRIATPQGMADQPSLRLYSVKRDGTKFNEEEMHNASARAIDEYNEKNTNNTIELSDTIRTSSYEGAEGAGQVIQKFYRRNQDGTKGELLIEMDGDEMSSLLIRKEQNKSTLEKIDETVEQTWVRGFKQVSHYNSLRATYKKFISKEK